MRVLIAGCGYVGTALGARLKAQHHEVTGLRRSLAGVDELVAAGIDGRMADITRRADLAGLPADWDWVIHCGAPSSLDAAGYRGVYVEGIRELIAWLRGHPPRAFVFTSSTSVYEQNDGSIVTEDSPTEPTSENAQLLLEAENLLRSAADAGFPGRILRVAGIYGPGRNRIEAMAKGKGMLPRDGDRWMNMVHRDDLVEAILRAFEQGRDGAVYNVADGSPVLQRDFAQWLLREMGRTQEAVVHDVSRSAGRTPTHKRVSAEKIRRELGWEPRFPSFREGYAASLEAWRRSR
jgi:nucleoside-diphosphate-sugar epimerase